MSLSCVLFVLCIMKTMGCACAKAISNPIHGELKKIIFKRYMKIHDPDIFGGGAAHFIRCVHFNYAYFTVILQLTSTAN